MRERAQQIHAELVVNSEIGKGTKICVEVPAK
jgi:signal transduction histidine kinase